MSTFTFKRGARGNALQRVGHPFASVDIKLGGQAVGQFDPPTWQSKDQKWGIRFKVAQTPTPANPCPWRWFIVKDRLDNESAARAYVLSHAAAILKLNLYTCE